MQLISQHSDSSLTWQQIQGMLGQLLVGLSLVHQGLELVRPEQGGTGQVPQQQASQGATLGLGRADQSPQRDIPWDKWEAVGQ